MSVILGLLCLTALSAILFDGLTDPNCRSHNHCFKNYHNKDVLALKFPREIEKKKRSKFQSLLSHRQWGSGETDYASFKSGSGETDYASFKSGIML